MRTGTHNKITRTSPRFVTIKIGFYHKLFADDYHYTACFNLIYLQVIITNHVQSRNGLFRDFMTVCFMSTFMSDMM